jgi:hypothetical protein
MSGAEVADAVRPPSTRNPRRDVLTHSVKLSKAN